MDIVQMSIPDPTAHNRNPLVSSNPAMMFRFCTAAPLAPLPRLSSIASNRTWVWSGEPKTYRSSRSEGSCEFRITNSDGGASWCTFTTGECA